MSVLVYTSMQSTYKCGPYYYTHLKTEKQAEVSSCSIVCPRSHDMLEAEVGHTQRVEFLAQILSVSQYTFPSLGMCDTHLWSSDRWVRWVLVFRFHVWKDERPKSSQNTPGHTALEEGARLKLRPLPPRALHISGLSLGLWTAVAFSTLVLSTLATF